MYSRSFSDKAPHLPPHYGGTALQGETCGRRREETDEERKTEREECRRECPPRSEAPCTDTPPPRTRGLLSQLLPFDVKGDDLLLLAIALLLLGDGCEDDYLPLILLFLLIIH